VLTQSLAIIEWLDEVYREPPLLPSTAAERVRVRALALAIACDIHPLNNTRVLAYLTGTLGVTDSQKDGWYRYWCDVGFEALETRLSREAATGTFCHGDAHARRHLSRPAACQRPPRRPRSRAVPDAASHRGCMPCTLPAFANAAPARPTRR
jgi:glutathione S-transferase